jgi:hypothetical protein
VRPHPQFKVQSEPVDAGYDAFMATAGRTLRRHMLGTTACIFVTFLLRSVFSTMFAVAFQLRDVDKSCSGMIRFCDALCTNVYTHISRRMLYAPNFQLVIVLISSPLALLVALWGMTSRPRCSL